MFEHCSSLDTDNGNGLMCSIKDRAIVLRVLVHAVDMIKNDSRVGDNIDTVSNVG